MVPPLLDSQVGFKNMKNVEHIPMSLEPCGFLFLQLGERHVHWDSLGVCTVVTETMRNETVLLRKD